MGKKFGFSFSARRASGLSGLKGRISKKSGIPLTRSGRQRKAGRAVGCCVAAFILLASLAAGGLLLSIVSQAGEVYMWVDEKGVKHITDSPPEKPAKIIGKETYQKDSPEEIKRYEKERELARIQNERETEQQREYNQAKESAEKMKDRFKSKIKEYEIQRNEKIKGDIEDLEARKKRLQTYENEARSESSRQYWKNEQRENDRDIGNKRTILDKSNR